VNTKPQEPQRISFRYFQDPHHFSTYSDEAQSCDICNRVRSGYEGPFYGEEAPDWVCEECLATGRLVEFDVTTNEADREALIQQICQLHPELTDVEVEAIAAHRTSIIEHATPSLVTWQPYEWPAHCGDYCRYLREVGIPDLIELAPDRDGQTFFGRHLHEGYETDVSEVWDTIRPDSPHTHRGGYSVGVYLFQCLECGEYVILWDCD
jgi:uncharacterized protein